MLDMPFTGNPLDRASNQRRDDAWLTAQLEHPQARYLPLWRLSPGSRSHSAASLLWLPPEQAMELRGACEPVLLGLQDGVPCFALDISHLDEPMGGLGRDEDVRFSDARSLAGELSIAEGGILAQARSLTDWHARHQFCAACGTQTQPQRGGVMRKCPACEAEHFPRTDPAVIMVVWKDNRCLLGRRSGRAGSFFSALAGYIEQGESIEEAVRREVLEEAGIVVDDVTYFASQPWPFPSSLMIGCFAHTEDEDVSVDPEEIAEARWFTRDQLRGAIEKPGQNDGFNVPGPLAIAHHLIKAWLER